ncbi:hypothetical protein PPSIR1_20254 [Plesiocystis pacifica SIR-1]|uniref:DUF4440 domain-containing protein n=1 Tax=Plesiocystis pacifica SIR-1 TaxID=391625 RepID=A6G227_9BACT|nr:nuclear transport factor 2 family protein [Plesiocystis pacifica]EDM79996.1 hypothetical protein PPSIR1_20254 [Plesiocystis pacifica SIR-1]
MTATVPPKLTLLALLTGASLMAACDPEPAAEAGKEAGEQVEAPNQAEAPKPEPVTKEEARAVFDAWHESQLNEDFEAYSKVFAADFEGIKRTGRVEKTLAREAWLAAREKSFEKGYSITATGVSIKAGQGEHEGQMIVRFTQRWATRTFADVGPKELRIARAAPGAEPLIVHEEMLSSRVTRRKGRADTPLAVLKIGPTHYAVLGVGSEGWVDRKAEPTMLNDATVTKALSKAKLGKAAKGWIGRELDVEGPGGQRCRTSVGDFDALAVIGRASGVEEADSGLMKIYDAGGTPTPEQMAKAMWKATKGDLYLVGRLDGCRGDLALPIDEKADAGVVDFATGDAIEPALATKVQAAFEALPTYVEDQADWVATGKEYGEPREAGSQWDDEARKVDQLWTDGKDKFVFHAVSVGEGCGEWSATQWAMWKVGDGDALELISSGREGAGASGMDPIEPLRLIRWHETYWVRTGDELYEIQPAGGAMVISATEPVFLGCTC